MFIQYMYTTEEDNFYWMIYSFQKSLQVLCCCYWWWCIYLTIHCMLLIRSDAGRCLCVRYRILLRLLLFLINKCTEAVILADIACSSPSHVTGLAGHLVAGQGKFVQSSGAVWCMGAQWARSLVILILSVSLALTGSHTQISCNHGQPVGPTDLDRISFILFCQPPSHFSY